MNDKYTTISVSAELFDELYLLKAMLMKGDRNKTWDNFMYEVIKIINEYIDGK